MINIGIIEDNEGYVEELKSFIESSDKLSCQFYVSSYHKLKKYYTDKLGIELFLIDLKLDDSSGLDCIKYIKRMTPETEIIVLTVYNNLKSILRCISTGASGYLLKYEPFENIEKAIIETMNGGSSLTAEIAREIISQFNPVLPSSPQIEIEELKKNEIRIIRLIDSGKGYNDIAQNLGLTIHGVKYHLKNIYKKMNVSSRIELLRQARLNGILED